MPYGEESNRKAWAEEPRNPDVWDGSSGSATTDFARDFSHGPDVRLCSLDPVSESVSQPAVLTHSCTAVCNSNSSWGYEAKWRYTPSNINDHCISVLSRSICQSTHGGIPPVPGHGPPASAAEAGRWSPGLVPFQGPQPQFQYRVEVSSHPGLP